MRTFANFPLRSHNMTSLKGKSLDTLARLGGHSFLNLPVEFAPSTLRLPACYVATATYLKVFGMFSSLERYDYLGLLTSIASSSRRAKFVS